MAPYDFLMLIVLAGATLFGFWKGLAWQIASVASIVLSYFAALKFSPFVMQLFGWGEPWHRFAAMLIVYVVASLAIWSACGVVRNAVDAMKLKDFDRQIGALVGFGKGLLFCVGITFFVVTLSESGREAVLASKSGVLIAQVLQKAPGVMPAELNEVLGPYLQRLENELDGAAAGDRPLNRYSNGDLATEAFDRAVDHAQSEFERAFPPTESQSSPAAPEDSQPPPGRPLRKLRDRIRTFVDGEGGPG